jgi:hypothetical protein
VRSPEFKPQHHNTPKNSKKNFLSIKAYKEAKVFLEKEFLFSLRPRQAKDLLS